MPEIANVISNEVIAAEWGNDIRNRTIQRYADATERTALHAAPVTGDMSYLENTGKVYVYYSGSWRTMYDDMAGTIAGYVQMGRDDDAVEDLTLSTTWETGASVSFTKPAAWVSFAIMASGSVVFHTGREGADPVAGARTLIGSTASGEMSLGGANDPEGHLYPLTIPVSDHLTGQTTSVAVAIQYRETTPAVIKIGSSVQYIAIRTA